MFFTFYILSNDYSKYSLLKTLVNQISTMYLCPVHVIWTAHQMSKLVLNVKYLLLLYFLTAAKFYNLGHIQGIRECPTLLLLGLSWTPLPTLISNIINERSHKAFYVG